MRERAPVAVCVHGAGGGGWEWAIWARAFAACGWRVVAPDLLPVADGLAATALADYRAQVLAWCAQASTPPVLIGASLGGLLALSVAAPANASALVLVNPLPPWGLPAGAPTPPIVRWGSARRFASTRRAMPDADGAARLFAFRGWRDESGRVLDEARRGLAVEAPACSMLVVASEDDDEVPCASSCRLAQDFRADFREVAGASHVGPLLGRSAAGVAENVVDWLHLRLREGQV